MEMGHWRVKFDTELPSFSAIESLFYDQTGLKLRLKADLQLRALKTSSAEVFTLLAEDAPVVARLQAEQQTLYQANPHEYELLAQYWDQMQMKLNKLNHICRVWFEIEDFYGVDFTVKENVITLETYPSRYYGTSSLMKVLIDLGEVGKKMTPI
jgi:hypothetical protein